jgi:hypothetical protein
MEIDEQKIDEAETILLKDIFTAIWAEPLFRALDGRR